MVGFLDVSDGRVEARPRRVHQMAEYKVLYGTGDEAMRPLPWREGPFLTDRGRGQGLTESEVGCTRVPYWVYPGTVLGVPGYRTSVPTVL